MFKSPKRIYILTDSKATTKAVRNLRLSDSTGMHLCMSLAEHNRVAMDAGLAGHPAKSKITTSYRNRDQATNL